MVSSLDSEITYLDVRNSTADEMTSRVRTVVARRAVRSFMVFERSSETYFRRPSLCRVSLTANRASVRWIYDWGTLCLCVYFCSCPLGYFDVLVTLILMFHVGNW